MRTTCFARHGEQAERVVRAQVVLDREREMPQIRERAQVLRVHAGALALWPVGGDVLVGACRACFRRVELQRAQLVLAGAFDGLQAGGSGGRFTAASSH